MFPFSLIFLFRCSETSGGRRGTVGDDAEGLGMGTFETEAQAIAGTMTASDGISTSSRSRLNWRSSAKWPRLVSVFA